MVECRGSFRVLVQLVPLDSVACEAVEALLDRAFEPGRRTRTAYRVREGVEAIPALSFAALLDDGRLAGTIQCWPVALSRDSGERMPMVMVGPVAVEPDLQQEGIGRALMARMLEAARDTGAGTMMLIGDPEYYGRFFGFSAEHTGRWRLPGPFDQRRLLALGDAVPEGPGEVGPGERTSGHATASA